MTALGRTLFAITAVAATLLVVPPTTAADTPQWQTLPKPLPLPTPEMSGLASVNDIKMYYAVWNSGGGDPVVLLHGGMGNAGNWGNQVPALMKNHEVIALESRGHGRSTRSDQPFSYHLMASDVLVALDYLKLAKVAVVGWSDGAIIGLDIAMDHPERLTRLWAYGANSNPAGMLDPSSAVTFNTAVARAGEEYAALSSTPKDFQKFADALGQMWASQPDFKAADFAKISVPVAIADGDHEELVNRANTEEMAAEIPGAKLVLLPNVSHFGAWQDPAAYNSALIKFLESTR